EDAAVAPGDGGQGQARARVAARALDDRPARPQQSAPLGVFDHGDADAVFDRAARVEELDLDEHRARQVGGDLRQPHEGGVADGAEDIIVPHGRPMMVDGWMNGVYLPADPSSFRTPRPDLPFTRLESPRILSVKI